MSAVVQIGKLNDLEVSRLHMAVKKLNKILTSRSGSHTEEIEIIEAKQMISVSLSRAEVHGIQS